KTATLAVVELVRMRLGQPAQNVHRDAAHGPRVADAMVHLVRREQPRDGARLVDDTVHLLEHAPVVASVAVDAAVPGLLVEAGDVADDPPASVLVRTAARAGPGDDRQGVKTLAPGGVQHVP